MKTIKYYYSSAMCMGYYPCVFDSHGDVIHWGVTKTTKSKKLPRITVASVYDKDNNSMYFGVAICSPKDNFKKSEGRKIAYERAMNNPNVVVSNIKKNQVHSISKSYANSLIDAEEQKFFK